MNTARMVVLLIALGAGGVAAYLASGAEDKPAQNAEPAPQLPTVEVLIARTEIGLGQNVRTDDLQWQAWPASGVSSSFIRRNDRPDAIRELAGAIARTPLMEGEPVREQKLVKAEGSGFMAAILPSGMRAVSTEISPETAAGGFVLPNDRVDVLLSRKFKNADSTQPEIVHSEIILSNIRVLAIDQAPKEKEGQNAVVGRTVTLELKPEQTSTLSAARQAGVLSLALRSIADANPGETVQDEKQRRAEHISVVRFGIARQAASQK